MSRRLRLQTVEMGSVELMLIYQRGEEWETEWRPLQGTPLASMLPVLTDEVVNHGLQGWTRPLVDGLGLPPVGALRKIPPEHRQCVHRAQCPFYDRTQCLPVSKRLPDCYHPENLGDERVQTLAYEVIRLWREGVYTVVVKEALDAERTYRRAR